MTMPLDFAGFEVLTFDCYGTLIDWESGILPILRSLLAAHAKKAEDAILLQLYGDFELSAEAAPYQTYREVLASVVRQFGKEFGFTPSRDEEFSLSDSLANWQPWPDTVSALQQLKRRYRLAILSNIDDSLFAATRPKLGVEFNEVITAEQAQAYKPSLKLFELALQRIQAQPSRVLHVGQSIYHDVLPAQKLGMAAVWVNRPSARPGIGAVKSAPGNPDLTVSNLAELANLAMES
jgi:2-haloacid dehalogenase